MDFWTLSFTTTLALEVSAEDNFRRKARQYYFCDLQGQSQFGLHENIGDDHMFDAALPPGGRPSRLGSCIVLRFFGTSQVTAVASSLFAI